MPSFSNTTAPGFGIGSSVLMTLAISIVVPGGCGSNFASKRHSPAIGQVSMWPGNDLRVAASLSFTRRP